MTQIFTGQGLGFHGSSINKLGGYNSKSVSRLGQGGGSVYVNAANGNMVLRQEDGFLADQGFGLGVFQTYNSRAEKSNWIFNVQTRLIIKGTINIEGSIVERMDEDGHCSQYLFDAGTGQYRAMDGSIATLEYKNGFWEHMQGKRDIWSQYDREGQLVTLHDRDGHCFTFYYENQVLTQITDNSGRQRAIWNFDKGRTQSVVMESDGVVIHKVSYEYDESGRLKTLTRGHQGNIFQIHYRYDNDSNRIKSIEQSDGIRCFFEYDDQGRLTKLKDGEGNITAYRYEIGHTIVSMPSGQEWTYYYDEASRLTGIDGPAHYRIRYLYDGNRLKTIVQGTLQWHFYYNDAGDCIRMEEPSGMITTREFDADHRLLKENKFTLFDGKTQPESPKTSHYIYDTNGHLRFNINPDGVVKEYRYNSQGMLSETRTWLKGRFIDTVLATLENIENWVSQQNLQQVSLTGYFYDWRGQCSETIQYNAVNNRGEGIRESALVTQTVYDAAGRLISKTVPCENGFVTTWYFYDALGRLCKEVSPSGRTKLIQYDDANHRIVEIDDSGLQTITILDLAGQVISIHKLTANQDLGTEYYILDGQGNRICETRADGRRTWHYYDGLGHLLGTVRSNGQMTLFIYDEYGNLIQKRECATNIAVHEWGKEPPSLDGIIPPSSKKDRITQYIYDNRGFLEAVIDPEGGVIMHVTNADGLVTEKRSLAKKCFHQDPSVRLTAQSFFPEKSSEDRVIYYYYNASRQLESQIDAEGFATEYIYDAQNRLIETIRHFQALKQFTGVWKKDRPIDHAKNIHSYILYNPSGLKSGEIDAEGFLVEYVYDARGNLTEKKAWYNRVNLKVGNQPVLEEIRPDSDRRDELTSYRYNASGICIEIREYQGLVTTFTLDKADRIIAVTRQDTHSGEIRRECSRYDALGRLIATLDATGARLLENRNLDEQSIENIWKNHGTQFTLDKAGRIIAKTNALQETTRFFYNDAGLLLYSVAADGGVTETKYNAFLQIESVLQYSNALSDVTNLTMDSLKHNLAKLANSRSDYQIRYTYNRNGQLESVYSGNRSKSQYTYNTFGEMDVSDDNLLNIEYRYDRRGLLIHTVKDPLGIARREINTFDAFGRLTEKQDAEGYRQRFQYDRCGRIMYLMRDAQGYRKMTWDAFGRLVSETDWSGSRSTQYQYENNTLEIISPEGQRLSYAKSNAFGETLTITNANGHVTKHFFNEKGQKIGIEGPENIKMQYRYDAAGRLIWQENGSGHIVQYSFDAVGRMITETRDPDGLHLVTGYTLDALGRRIRFEDASGQVKEFSWNAEGLLESVCVDPKGLRLTTRFIYDEAGHLSRTIVSNPQGSDKVTAFQWDVSGRRIATIEDPDGLNLITRYFYDGRDNLIEVQNPEGHSTHYIYDSNNRCHFTIDASGAVIESRYDVNGNNTHTIRYAINIGIKSNIWTEKSIKEQIRQSEQDQWQIREFDTQNRLVLSFDAAGYAISYGYDAKGNIRQIIRYAKACNMTALKMGNLSIPSEAYARKTFYLYDTADRLRFTIDSNGCIKEQQWDASGRCIQATTYANRMVDAENIDTITQQLKKDSFLDQTIYFAYDKAGRLSFQKSAEGTLTAWVYDGADNIISTRVFAKTLNHTTITRENFFIHAREDLKDRIERQFYDAAGRMLYSVSAEGSIRGYEYDNAGNKIRETDYSVRISHEKLDIEYFKKLSSNNDRLTKYHYDATGRLVQSINAADKHTDYTYDKSGNISKKTEAGIVWTYSYDANSRLIETHSPEVTIHRQNASGHYESVISKIVTRLVYDSFGNLITRIQDADGDAHTIHYLFDTRNQLCEIRYPSIGVDNAHNQANSDRQETSTILSELKAYNAFGEIISSRDKAGNWRYFARDNMGRVRFSLDAAGGLTENRYDSFGNCISTIVYATMVSPPKENTLEGFLNTCKTSNKDRQCVMLYDRDNRLVLTRRPSERSYNPLTRQYEQNLAAETQITYDAFGNITTKSIRLNSSAWAITRYYYDREGHISAELDAMGYLKTRVWNVYGELEQEVLHAKPTSLEGEGYAIPTSDPDDRHYEYIYDNAGHVICKTQKQVQHAKLKPDGHSYTMVVTDLHTRYSWDPMGNMVMMQDPAGHTIFMYYDALGQLTARIGPEMAKQNNRKTATTYAYDANGNLAETYYWSEGASKADLQGYSLIGNSINDISTKDYYDAAGHVIQSIDGMGHSRYFSYDANGNMARQWEVIKQLGGKITRDIRYNWDAEGRLLKTKTFKTVQDYLTEEVKYNAFGEVTDKGINGRFHVHVDYDKLGRVWRSNIQGHHEIYIYDLADHVTQIVKASNAVTLNHGEKGVDLSTAQFEGMLKFDEGIWAESLTRQDNVYDTLGRMYQQRKTHTQSLAIQAWRYDGFGNMIFHRSAQGYETSYTWNALNVLVEKTLPEVWVENTQGQIIRMKPKLYFASDEIGQIIAIQDGNGHTTGKRYDAMGRVIQDIDAMGNSTFKHYDLLGQLKDSVNSKGGVTLYTYDREKRLIQVTAGDTTQKYTLNEAGQMLACENGEGDAQQYWYDSRGNLIRKKDTRGYDTWYGYDDEGHKILEKDALNNTQSWEYENGFLNSWTDLGGHTHHYDRNVNGLLLHDSSTRGRKIHYRYTDDGLLRQFEDESQGETVNFIYDLEGRNIQRESSRTVNGQNGWLIEKDSYSYDAMGRLVNINREQSGSTTLKADYTYDAAGNIRHTKVVSEGRDQKSSQTDDYYTYDANNRMIINRGQLINGQIAITDKQGTECVLDAAGNIVEAKKYEQGTLQSWKYFYNSHNQLELIQKNNQRIQTKTYDRAGRIRHDTLFNAFGNTYKIYTMGWDKGVLDMIRTGLDYGSLELSREKIEYDAVGNRVKTTVRVQATGESRGYTMYHIYSHEEKTSTYQQTKDVGILQIDGVGTTTGVSTRTYDVNGQLTLVKDAQPGANSQNNTTHFTYSSLDGMRSKRDYTGETHYLSLAGRIIGDVRVHLGGKSELQVYAGFTPTGKSDDTPSKEPILPEMPQEFGGEYTLQANESLEQVAFQVYGDSSLWYVIADANGITDRNARAETGGILQPGQRLRIPPVTKGQHHTNATHKVMDDMIGNTAATLPLPQLPPPPRGRRRSLLAKIVVSVVTMVTTVLVAATIGSIMGPLGFSSIKGLGAFLRLGMNILTGEFSGALAMGAGFVSGVAGNLAGQGAANLLGIQKGLDVKSAIIQGLTTAASIGTSEWLNSNPLWQTFNQKLSGISPKEFFNLNTAAKMMQSDLTNQGINLALSREARFNWAELVSAGLTGGIFGSEKIRAINERLDSKNSLTSKMLSQEVKALTQGAAYALASGTPFKPESLLKDHAGESIANALLEKGMEVKKEARTGMAKILEELNFQTDIINNLSLTSDLSKLGYESYKKSQSLNVLAKSGKLHAYKMKKATIAWDMEHAQKNFKPDSKSWRIFEDGKLSKGYNFLSKFGQVLNVFYVGAEMSGAYKENLNESRGVKVREMALAGVGAMADVAVGGVSSHAIATAMVKIGSYVLPINPLVLYTTTFAALLVGYNKWNIGDHISDMTKNGVKSLYGKNSPVYFSANFHLYGRSYH